MSDPGARTSDPLGSHEALASITKWQGLREAILMAAQTFDPAPFDDGDLTEYINHIWSTGVQRNVVARSRGILEREGKLVRIGNRRHNGKATMHFRLPDNQTRAAQPAPPVPVTHARTRYTELNGIAWCTTHQEPWLDGEEHCHRFQFGGSPADLTDYCDEVSLFIAHEQE